MKNNSISISTQLTKVLLCAFAIWITSILILKCTETQDQQLSPSASVMQLKSVPAKPAEALIIQPGDTTYRPILWGAELRVVPNIIYQGNHRKYGRYWFCKTMAYQVVKPANYQQDSVRERVAFADSALITNLDTFYICRRIIH